MQPNPPTPNGNNRRRAQVGVPCLALLFILALAGALFVSYEFYLRDRIAPGVRVLGEDVGGLTRAEAEVRLQDQVGNPNELFARSGGEPLVLRDGARVFRASPRELGFRTDLKPVLDAALAIGHRGDFAQDVWEQTQVWWNGAAVTTRVGFDQELARAYLKTIAPQINRPARAAQVRLDGLRVVEIPGQKGRALGADETVKRIRARLLDLSAGDIALAVDESDPPKLDAAAARIQTENFLRAPLVLTFDDRAWALDQATLASLIVLQSAVNPDGSLRVSAAFQRDALAAQVKKLAREIDQLPRDARFRFDNGALRPLITSQEGRTLDVDATVKQIEARFAAAATAETRSAGNASPALAPRDALRANTLALDVQIQKPAVDMRDRAKMGIKELVAQGVSNFKHSIPGRIQNIKTATASFDGVVVPPGETFSFVKYLSEVVEANGYEDAYIIFRNRTILGPGGGVCQVSSTLFRAAFFGGFPIVERWAHAYRVSYYEPPVGLDATVFAPDVDFQFTNDTGAYILIEPGIDEKNTTLTFNFYGTKPNRQVKLIGPEVTNVKPHGPPIYTDDPSLPKGTLKQVDFAVDGEDVTIFREIYVNGQLVKRDKFFSRYQPWQARYLRGTRVK